MLKRTHNNRIAYYNEWLELHRDDGPAVERFNGTKEWHINGKLHRENGPAIEWFDGEKMWYYEGKLHRTDGPAIVYSNGYEWYYEGKLHRKNGPAIEYSNGTKQWFLNGRLHRENGPAIEYSDGTKQWYYDGKKLSEQEFLREKCSRNLLSIEIPEYYDHSNISYYYYQASAPVLIDII